MNRSLLLCALAALGGSVQAQTLPDPANDWAQDRPVEQVAQQGGLVSDLEALGKADNAQQPSEPKLDLGRGKGIPLPTGKIANISTNTTERFTTLPYYLYDAPRSTREAIAQVTLVPPKGDLPQGLADSFIVTTTELVGATTLVLPLVNDETAPFERRIEFLVVDEISEAYQAYLEEMIRRMFPTVNASVLVANSQTAVLNGYVDKAQFVAPIEQLVRGFLAARSGTSPESVSVVNALRVTGVQQVQLKVMICEVNRSKQRELGFEFNWTDLSAPLTANLSNLIGFNAAAAASAPGIPTLPLAGGVQSQSFSVRRDGVFLFDGFVRAMVDNRLGKIMAEPTLVTLSGQPAFFNVGGEVPILIPQGNGTISVEFRPFGTNLRFVPTVLGTGRIRLEVRPEVSERDDANGIFLAGVAVPGFRTRVAETTVELDNAQTFAIAGLIQQTVVAQTLKVPLFGDIPVVGAAFQNKNYRNVDTELLIMVTPFLVEAMDERPCKLPGRDSRVPNDIEFYLGNKFEPPCFPDPYRDHWKKRPVPCPEPVRPYDNYGNPVDMTLPTQMVIDTQVQVEAAPENSAEPATEEKPAEQPMENGDMTGLVPPPPSFSQAIPTASVTEPAAVEPIQYVEPTAKITMVMPTVEEETEEMSDEDE